jgi:hypothetical protein
VDFRPDRGGGRAHRALDPAPELMDQHERDRDRDRQRHNRRDNQEGKAELDHETRIKLAHRNSDRSEVN